MQFRVPNFLETKTNVYKDSAITERVNFQIRFEFFNLFNRANYANPDTNIADGSFGAATGSHEPRFWQLGGRISFCSKRITMWPASSQSWPATVF